MKSITPLTTSMIRPMGLSQVSDPALFQGYEIGAISMASRAAIEGGVDYALAVEYRSRFTQQLSSATNDTDKGLLFIQAFTTFASLVQRVQEAPGSGALSRKVSRCVQAQLYQKRQSTTSICQNWRG